ncbi:177f4590-385e-4eaa-9cc2-c2030f7f65eb [Sclerotinia trifoliorum]|uniref:177f4590-385e-4eaa-9cc2-c2030f7f65eb n=1 Tax=Sclerotinia trifoliorum TaxID=28548 RepID=A0A8H2W6C8_9HELO|nr:177f4590-385e-4eaa-9cc2-c2030f7f65eb [Sclerotinia trifoliorum]
MENINNAMAATTVDTNNEESHMVVCSERNSNGVNSQCAQSSLQFTRDLSHGSAQGVDTAPGKNISHDALQTRVVTPGKIEDAIGIGAKMRAKLEESYAEMRPSVDLCGSSRPRDYVFVFFPFLPKELQLKIWKEAAIRKGTDLDIVTEVLYRPGTKAQPNPRFIPNKQYSSLFHTCRDSREVLFKQFYTHALQYEKEGLRVPYAPVYSHCDDIIYLQIDSNEYYTTVAQEVLSQQSTIFNAVNQGVTNLALNFDIWSCYGLTHEIKALKKLKRLIFVVASPYRGHRGRYLRMYAVNNSEFRCFSIMESLMLFKLQEVFANLKEDDPKWVRPIVELVYMRIAGE